MVAYSYQPQFIDPTLSGRKIHTIRAVGKRRHARPGEKLQHYVGMRTKQCRLFARSTCIETLPIRLAFLRDPNDDMVQIEGKRPWVMSGLDEFAYHDGFDSWVQLRAFWKLKHDAELKWDGVIIYWRDVENPL